MGCRELRGLDKHTGADCDECIRPRLLPENEPAARLYMDCQTQWRYGPDGRPTGMDYTGVRSYMAAVRKDLKFTAADFQAMQVIEHSTLAGLREQRTKDGTDGDTH